LIEVSLGFLGKSSKGWPPFNATSASFALKAALWLRPGLFIISASFYATRTTRIKQIYTYLTVQFSRAISFSSYLPFLPVLGKWDFFFRAMAYRSVVAPYWAAIFNLFDEWHVSCLSVVSVDRSDPW